VRSCGVGTLPLTPHVIRPFHSIRFAALPNVDPSVSGWARIGLSSLPRILCSPYFVWTYSRAMDGLIEDLITSYHEFNGSTVDILHEMPSPLEFSRYVGRNRPFIVRQGASDWPALRKWSVSYLKSRMEGRKVTVAVTPEG
jgi:hypothetical protein